MERGRLAFESREAVLAAGGAPLGDSPGVHYYSSTIRVALLIKLNCCLALFARLRMQALNYSLESIETPKIYISELLYIDATEQGGFYTPNLPFV